MVEPVVHFSIPFCTLALSGASSRRAMFASFLALLPDLDVLAHLHRSVTHSALLVAAVAVPLVVLTWSTKYRIYAVLAAVGLASHLVLDLFSGYTPLLWPIYNQDMWLVIRSLVHIGSIPSVTLDVDMLTRPITFESFHTLDVPIFTSGGLVISSILLASVLLKNLGHSFREAQR